MTLHRQRGDEQPTTKYGGLSPTFEVATAIFNFVGASLLGCYSGMIAVHKMVKVPLGIQFPLTATVVAVGCIEVRPEPSPG